MSTNGSSTPQMQPVQTQAATQSREPWSGAAPYYTSMYGAADAMRSGGVGYQPYSAESTYVGMDDPALGPSGIAQRYGETLGSIWGHSVGDMTTGPAGIPEAQAYGKNFINQGGITPHVQSGLNSLGIAEGWIGQQRSQAEGDENPFLQAMLDAQNRKISDKVNSAFGGAGRYGSGQHTDIATRALAEADAPVLAQDYARRQELMRQLTGMEAGLGQTRADIGARAANQTGQWAQMMPQLDEARWAPSKRVLGVLDAYRQDEQNQRNARIGLHNAEQAYPWEQLFRENAVIGSGGGMGGTTTGSTSVSNAQAPTWQRVLGGALAGGGLGSSFGPWGAGLGAIGGGAAGAFL